MWKQDFELLKAQFCNNMAACYQKMGDLQKADVYNNWALKECPDYAKAMHRKCLILEEKGEYSTAAKIAEWCAQRFDHEEESETNQEVVPLFIELVDRCKPKLADEVSRREELLRAEANAEFDACWEEDD